MKAPQPRQAFTLVELLVVIGVIGILASLLLPALTGANAQAKMAACINNLAQIGRAAVAYSGNYGFQFPAPAHADTIIEGQLNDPNFWDGHKDGDDYLSYTWKGKLYGYIGGREDLTEDEVYKILKCPSVRQFNGHKSFYGTNAYITMYFAGEDADGAPVAERILQYGDKGKMKSLHFDHVESTSQTFMIGENNTGHWAVRPEDPRKEADFTPATEDAILYTRHGEKSTWVFFDGSAKALTKPESQARRCYLWFDIKKLSTQ